MTETPVKMTMSSLVKLIVSQVKMVESNMKTKTSIVVVEGEHGDGTYEIVVREDQKLQRWLKTDTGRDHSWVSLQYNEPLQV